MHQPLGCSHAHPLRVTDLFVYNGVVVTPHCPSPTKCVVPDAMGNHPAEVCHSPSFVNLLGKDYYVVADSLNQGVWLQVQVDTGVFYVEVLEDLEGMHESALAHP